MSGNRPTEEDYTYLSDLLVVRDLITRFTPPRPELSTGGDPR